MDAPAHAQRRTRRRALCRLDGIPGGGARGFTPAPGGGIGLFAVRRGGRVFACLNTCPHAGVALEWRPHRFLNAAGTPVVCSVHGAEPRVVDGVRLRGPREGNGLEAIPCEVVDGVVLVPDNAGL